MGGRWEGVGKGLSVCWTGKFVGVVVVVIVAMIVLAVICIHLGLDHTMQPSKSVGHHTVVARTVLQNGVVVRGILARLLLEPGTAAVTDGEVRVFVPS